jgi:putative MATE family efflux protein
MFLQKIRDNLQNVFKTKNDLDLTNGPVGKNLFYLSLPIVIINLLQVTYNIADTFWLGQLSKDALAAITFAFPLVFFLISLGMGVSVAGSVLIAQFEGNNRRDRVDFAASQTITFFTALSVILGALGYFFIGRIVRLMGASPDVAVAATGYMQIVSIGLFFMFGFFVFMSLMRGYGDTVTPMILMFVTVVLNIVLDPFLIFGWWIFPAMGVEGAAIATVFSRGLAMLVGLYLLWSGRRGIEISLPLMKPDPGFLKKMLHIGVPASIESTGRSISVNALVAVIGLTFADTIVAGYGIGVRIFSMIFLPAIAVGKGVETMTGQNLGAGNFDRAGESPWIATKYTFAILTSIGVLTFVLARPISAIFTTDPAVADVSAQFLRYVALSFGFIGVLRAYTGSFRGAGKTITAAVISIATLGLIRLPIAAFAAPGFGAEGVWAAFFISNILGGAIAYGWYQRGTWRQSLTEEERQKGQVAEDTDGLGQTLVQKIGEVLPDEWY